jgi:hypothetical protein
MMSAATRAAFLFACAVIAGSTVAWAQIGAPTLGFVPVSNQGAFRIRTMQGIPAAGVVGPVIETGRDLALITVSPQQNYILAMDAETGQVLLVTPTGANGSTITVIQGATANPDSIDMSPGGASAVLWFNATNHAQIVSGLPALPSIREIDASFINAGQLAVSDDGNWLAIGTQTTGVYLFAADGSMTTIPIADRVIGLAFFYNRDALAIATPSRILTADPVSTGPPVQAANLNPESNAGDFATVGLAVTPDNQRIVAEEQGLITTINLATGSASALDCGCDFEGFFGLGGSIFRITSPGFRITSPGSRTASLSYGNGTHFAISPIQSGTAGVKLFDAVNNRLLMVPEALSAALPPHAPMSSRLPVPDATPALPAVTIGLPASSGPAQQPAMTISLASAYSLPITGTATLTFASSVGGDDQTIQFGTSGRTVAFTIPAGATQASFLGAASVPSVPVVTGTVAGTITVTLDLMAGGTDITPTPAPTASITVIATVPFIQSVLPPAQQAGGFTVVVTGFSTTRDMVSGTFQFAPSSNATLATTTVTVPLSTAFATWYSNSASNATGSEFMLTVPFTTSNGPPTDVIAVTVTLTNSKGVSTSFVNNP